MGPLGAEGGPAGGGVRGTEVASGSCGQICGDPFPGPRASRARARSSRGRHLRPRSRRGAPGRLLRLQREAGNAAVGTLVQREATDLAGFGLGDPQLGVGPSSGSRLLRIGSSGPDVVGLQGELNRAGADPRVEADGRFGPRTRAAVLEFQRNNGLDADGVVGPLTRSVLDAAAGGGEGPEQPLLKGHEQDVPSGGLEVLTRDGGGDGGGQLPGAGGLLGFLGKPTTAKGEDQSQMAPASEIGSDVMGMLIGSSLVLTPGRGAIVLGLLGRIVGLPTSFQLPQIADDPPGALTMDPMVRALVVVASAVEALQSAVASDPTVHPNVTTRLQVYDAFFTRRRDEALGGQEQSGSRIAVVSVAMAEIGKVDEKSTGGPPCDTIGHESKPTAARLAAARGVLRRRLRQQQETEPWSPGGTRRRTPPSTRPTGARSSSSGPSRQRASRCPTGAAAAASPR